MWKCEWRMNVVWSPPIESHGLCSLFSVHCSVFNLYTIKTTHSTAQHFSQSVLLLSKTPNSQPTTNYKLLSVSLSQLTVYTVQCAPLCTYASSHPSTSSIVHPTLYIVHIMCPIFSSSFLIFQSPKYKYRRWEIEKLFHSLFVNFLAFLFPFSSHSILVTVPTFYNENTPCLLL